MATTPKPKDNDPLVTEDGPGDEKDGVTLTDTPTTDETSQGSEVTGEDQSKGAKDYPEPQSAKGAFVNDEGIDLNEEGDHGPNVQGNKYPFNKDAAGKFRDEADARIRELEREIERLKAERDEWDKVANDTKKDN